MNPVLLKILDQTRKVFEGHTDAVDAIDYIEALLNVNAGSSAVRADFVQRMAEELEANTHKGAWNEWRPTGIHGIRELRHHVGKLGQAIQSDDAPLISEYCADVANIAMKIDEVHGRDRSSPRPDGKLTVIIVPVEAHASLMRDRTRLNWLEECRTRFNAFYGSTYGWKLHRSDKVHRLMMGRHFEGRCGDVDLTDTNAGIETHNDVRSAIDRAIAECLAGNPDNRSGWNETFLTAHDLLRITNWLRQDEGSTVTLVSDNPDFNGNPNCKVVCCGDWTGWNDREFVGGTIIEALKSAFSSYNTSKAVPK